MVSQKDLKILVYLFEQAEKKKSVTIEELAERFQISNRTVRNNLERIDYYLKSNNLPQLNRGRKNGIILDLDPEALESSKHMLLEMDVENYVFSKEERILYLKLLLFDTEKYLTYDQLSQELFVSRKTVIDDVHSVKKDCEKMGVQLIGTKRGLQYKGMELQLRKLLIDSLLEKFTPLELWEILRDIYPNKSIIIEKKWRMLAGNSAICQCEDFLRQAEQKGKTSITDAQYYMIVVLSVLALKRREKWESNFSIKIDREAPRYLREYFSQMQRDDSLDFGELEKGYLLVELQRIFNLENLEKSESMSLAMVEQLLLEVSKKAGKDYFNDSELRVSLQKHLMSLVENSFVNYQTDGGNMKAIIDENPVLYDCIRNCLLQFHEVDLNIDSELESALLMLHFLAADERSYMKNTNNYSTIIICNNGVGTAKIVSARIKQYFPQIQIHTTTAARNAGKEISDGHPDFIISTVPFDHPNLPVILVNTLPTEDDLKKIRIFLNSRIKLSKKRKSNDVYAQVMEAIADTCKILDGDGLEKRLAQIFSVEEKAPELLDSLTEKEIQVGLTVDNWEDAIRKSAEPLVKQGYVTSGYVDCMVENVKKTGPYIVITKGIALPHALAEAGVNRSGISLATLKEPVEFGNKVNDPVKLVICIATSDKKEHMREMSRLINFISNKKNVRKVNEADSPEDILKIIHNV